MQQVLFWIPLHSLWNSLPDIPIYGYGTMLFLAFVFCTWLACKLGEREGYPREKVQDMCIWVFIAGILGARVTFFIQNFNNLAWLQFFAIWDGGLVFYGSFIGGAIGFLLAYGWFLRKHQIRFWKMADITAPCLALGLCLGRIGCLLNGCCFGEVACPGCPSVTFPISSPPRITFVERGLQTPAGFTMVGGMRVDKVEPHSPAADAGVRAGDTVLKINGKDVDNFRDLELYFVKHWERGRNDIEVAVRHPGGTEEVDLPAYSPRTLGLHPTQIYESISMVLLLFALLSYFPLKKHDGSVLVFFMAAYAVHRFLNEMLRTDNDIVAFDMTLSQNLSILALIIAGVMAFFVWRRTPEPPTPAPEPSPAPTSA